MNLKITRRFLKLDISSVASATGLSENTLVLIESTPSRDLQINCDVKKVCSYYSSMLNISPEKLVFVFAQGGFEGFKAKICKQFNIFYTFIGGLFLDGSKKI